MPVHVKTSVNTPHFSYPYGATIFIAAIPTGFQIANTKKEGSHRMGARLIFLKPSRLTLK
jgi:hypothetical protein